MTEPREVNWGQLLARVFGIPDLVTPEVARQAIADQLLGEVEARAELLFGPIENQENEISALLDAAEKSLADHRLDAWLVRRRDRPDIPSLVYGSEGVATSQRMGGAEIPLFRLEINRKIVERVELFIRTFPFQSECGCYFGQVDENSAPVGKLSSH